MNQREVASEALLQLRYLGREYAAGEATVAALKNINLEIHAGEMIAIVGVSGSGKSTLMNILGCLDRPTSGTYRIAAHETAAMKPDELARLRREHFGFIFQRYHLLGDLTALENTELPAIYAGMTRRARRERATALLNRVGMADRVIHKPGELSGGQQQRVSIARALMNGSNVILADEPTGALDSRSGEEVMKVLGELHTEGHTIIVVTHDAEVASHAPRIIEIHDGEVVADRANPTYTSGRDRLNDVETVVAKRWQAMRDRLIEALHMAILAMRAHRMRTFLTMLGIIIGIASVVSVVALGNGSRQKILEDISSLGTNTVDIYPGADFGDPGSVQTLRADDAAALATQSYVDSATPVVNATATAKHGNVSANAQVGGVGERFFRVRGIKIAEGSFFDAQAVRQMDQSVIIDFNTRKKFFGERGNSPIGQFMLLNQVPSRIIGVTQSQSHGFGANNGLNVWVPYTTVMGRMLGQMHISAITVRVTDETPIKAAEHAITKLMQMRHGRKDFFLVNTSDIRRTIEATTRNLALLIGAIAAISLIVGGIGVMNIMLVSVTERTREIGVRMAVGARQGDILQQFLIEAILVCLIGGVLGVVMALGLGWTLNSAGGPISMIFSTTSVVAAFVCSTVIGVVFGFLPARNAARLDPVNALARE